MAQHEISRLLQNGADHGKQIPGQFGTVLQQATYSGKLELVKLLVCEKKGENITVGGKAISEMPPLLHDMSLSNISCLGGDYGTALQAAAARGYTDVVKCLLNSDADPNVEGWCFIIAGELMSNNYD